jgi:large subunit ribosomal protein L25
MEPVSVQAHQNDIAKVYKEAGKHAPVHLDVAGKSRIAMIKDIDIDHIKNNVRHISFHAVKASDPVIAEVPIRLVGEGESEAEKAGLIILQNLESVEVKALPMDLPDAIEVSIAHLKEPGERVTLGDAKLMKGVEFVEHTDGHAHDEEDEEEQPTVYDLMVATVWEPSALAAQNDAAGGDAEDESEVESENGSEDVENADAPTNSADDRKPE